MGAAGNSRKAWSDFVKEKSSNSEDDMRAEKKRKMAKSKKGVPRKMPKGRIRKPKRPIKIDGLDILHSKTLLSTSDQTIGMRLPPAQGCVDEHLAAYAGTMIHEELDVPSSTEIPYALKILLDVYKAQFMGYIDSMKSAAFKENLHRQIESKRDEYKRLMNRTGQLEKQIKVLVEDSVVLLKARMQELGINTTSQNDLLCKAKEIVGKHKELQIMANKIQQQVDTLEEENKQLTEKQSKQLIDFELASKDSHDLVLKEIENTLIQRKNLRNKMINLEAEVAMIEKSNDDKKPSIQQQPSKIGIQVAGNIYKSTPGPTKASKKVREHRSKTHEWPEIPEIGRIEEKNPEILAQKILETGRQIEAGKLLANPQSKQAKMESSGQQKKNAQQFNSLPKVDPMSMAAPVANMKGAKVHQGGLPRAGGSKKGADSHKVVNFEDRLKSIITSALQGQDQQQVNPQQSIPPPQATQQKQQTVMIPTTSGSPKKSAPVQMQMQYPGGNWNQQHLHQQQQQHQPQQISPTKIQRQMVSLPQMAPNPDQHQSMQHQESTYSQLKRNEHLPNFAKAMNMMHQSEANKLYQRPTQHQQMQMIQQQQQNQYLQNQRDRERENLMLFQQRQVEEKREFKTPDNVRYERQDMGRSSVGSIESEYINTGGSGSGGKVQTQRSSSSLSQPDYTQVSPAKLALRRHLSQEKLSQNPPQLMTKTIGDFINAEIEKTLEITPQSIINAVIQHNMPQSNVRMADDSVINFSINQDREMDDHHPYATLKPAKNHPQQHFQPQFHEHFEQRQKNMLPGSSKVYAPSGAAVRKSAISSPPIRHEEPINFISGPKSPDRHHHRHMYHPKEQEASSSSYKIDTKMFTSNIGNSYQAKEMKDARGPEPLEGLAASLRQHVIASMKIKEETEVDSKYAYANPQMTFPHIIKKESELKF